MFVQLAHEYKGHPADAVIEVEDLEGRNLLHYGHARRPDKLAVQQVRDKTAEELREFAGAHGIEVPAKARKDDLVDAVASALVTDPPTPDTPAADEASTETEA